MRNLILPAVVAIGLGSAAPAVAYDTGDQISMQAALDVASDIGVMTISHTESSPATNGRSKAVTVSAAGWKSMWTPERARCATSIAAGSGGL
ncbi:hypothetical protein ACVWWK_002094 [Bradyrhizobium sp. LB9.1b]